MAYTVRKTRPAPPRPKVAKGELITFEKFYKLVDELPKVDLLDGKIIRDSPVVPRHSVIVSWLVKVLGVYVMRLHLGEVLTAPVSVKLTQYNAPEPDVVFIAQSRLKIIAEKYIAGPPDLCVEVISRSSRRHDRHRKFVLYAEHDVKEYWIIDPIFETVEFFENQGGKFVAIPPDAQTRLHSKAVPGFWLEPGWLFASPPPSALEVLPKILGPGQALL